MWTVIGVALWAAGCAEAPSDGSEASAERWVTVAEGLPGALLSVNGRAADDVWAVGANVPGEGPLVVHWDGAAWETLDTRHLTHDLWWTWLEGDAAVWAVGSSGAVARYDRTTGEWEVEQLDDAATLFGVWGSGPDDVWVVGSDVSLTSDGARAWHYDGVAWSAVALPPAAAAVSALFKVWGRGADDVWMCGAHGMVLRWQGEGWTVVPTGSTAELFTVSGSDDEVWVAGGAGAGTILHWGDGAWADESPGFAPTLPGVFAGGRAPVAAGYGGSVWRRGAAGWAEDPRGVASFQDLHAVWAAPDGGVWATGGAIKSVPLRQGTLVYGGDAPPAALTP
jgi:hypothetical protein